MKALVKFALGEEGLALRDVPIPEIRDGEVLLKIKAVGICGSDIHSLRDERETVMPVILGHEFVGVIEKTKGDVGDLKVGDWVTGLPAAYSCGHCDYCERGEVSLCNERKSVGSHVDGAMAEYMRFPASFCYKVPDDYPDKYIYAAAEPLVCTVRGVYEKLNVNEGDVAVVSGPGTIGLYTAQALKSKGAYVIVSGLPSDRHRLDKALEMGMDEVVESFEELQKAVYAKNPEGADVSVECSGAAPSLNCCLDITKKKGQILQMGIYGKPINNIKFDQMFNKELTVVSSNSTAVSSWKIALDLIEKHKVDIAPVISLRLPIDEWRKGFDAVIDKTAYKVILLP